MAYDGDGLRIKKTENGTSIYYLRSTALGGQVVAEINQSGSWTRGHVYLGGQTLAIQDVPNNRVLWVHQEPYSKAQRLTDAAGAVVSGVEVDPFGGETNRSFDTASVNQRQRYTSYERDGNGGDEAQLRRYERWHSRFYQPDPSDGSYDLSNPQSLNRYSYVGNDPVNFTDPTGLNAEAFCFAVENWNPNTATLTITTRCHIIDTGGGISGGNPGGEIGGGPGGSIGNDPPTPTAQQSHCGLNPVTGQPGFQRDPRGVPGNLRPGVRGQGQFNAPRASGVPHTGLDMSGQSGSTPVFAFYPGRVTEVRGSTSAQSGYGLRVIVDHGGGYTSMYAHLSGASVRAQDTAAIFADGLGVIAGQVGVVGQSGNAYNQPSTEAHVHFEISRNGVRLDPERFLNSPCPSDLPRQ